MKYLNLIFIFVLFACKSTNNTSVVATKYGTIADSAMVVSSSVEATNIGLAVLRRGGNAFDAAVAMQFALSVSYPRAGNIGGGGFMVYRLAKGEVGSLDFRETAPLAATKDMFLDSARNVVPNLSRKGHLSVGVPGTVAGMEAIHRKFGTQKWFDLVYPSVRLALGFTIKAREADRLNKYRTDFLEVDSLNNPYLQQKPWQAGDTLKNAAYSNTLLRIAEQGASEFYSGETARLILAEMRRHGGVITATDLAQYTAVWRKPMVGTYRGFGVISMPPPSGGGIALLQLLKGTEPYNIAKFGQNSTKHVQLMVELERRVFADRAEYLGDPDFIEVPQNKLLSPEYLKKRFADVSLTQKTNSQTIKAGKVQAIEHFETTHFSIVDAQGNAVAITTTLNDNFGSRVVVDGAGFLLNDEMDDFSAKPGTPNMFGLVGSHANAIAPKKRMLSSMAPTIITDKNNQLFAVIGTPGGSTIITTVYQCVMNLIDFRLTMQDAILSPKIHAQWLPDEVYAEPPFMDSPQKAELERMGHQFKKQSLGLLDCILVQKNGKLEGAQDHSKEDGGAQGY